MRNFEVQTEKRSLSVFHAGIGNENYLCFLGLNKTDEGITDLSIIIEEDEAMEIVWAIDDLNSDNPTGSIFEFAGQPQSTVELSTEYILGDKMIAVRLTKEIQTMTVLITENEAIELSEGISGV